MWTRGGLIELGWIIKKGILLMLHITGERALDKPKWKKMIHIADLKISEERLSYCCEEGISRKASKIFH